MADAVPISQFAPDDRRVLGGVVPDQEECGVHAFVLQQWIMPWLEAFQPIDRVAARATRPLAH